MNFYWIKAPKIIKRLFSSQVWDIPNPENKIYLTFDDGPTSEITTWILSVLKQNNIKASFFCIGKNIAKNPEIFKQIISEGHCIGNHSYNHNNGWKTKTENYIKNVEQCNSEICNLKPETCNQQSKFFRPPYGKITPWQSRKMQNLGYKIIMWDILSADFDTKITPEKCLQNATQKVKSGSIIVFHDSEKAFANLEYALPKTIEILRKKGFTFDVLPTQPYNNVN